MGGSGGDDDDDGDGDHVRDAFKNVLAEFFR